MQSLTQKAIAAAIHLVSRCSDYPVQKLEQMYHVQCASAAFDDMEKEGEDEQLENGGDQEHEAEDADAVKPILDEIMKVAAEETADNNKESEENEPADRDPDCALPDSEELIALTSSCPEPANNAVLDGAKTFPKNLREAVADSQGLWSGLWGLAVHLRCGKHGLDGKFLKKGEVVRHRSRHLNWNQCPSFARVVIVMIYFSTMFNPLTFPCNIMQPYKPIQT